MFWFGVRMLLYLVKYLRPYCANMTRELLKVNSGENPGVCCVLPCVIRYVLNTNNLASKLDLSKDASKPGETVC